MDRRLAPLLIIPILMLSFMAGYYHGRPDYMQGQAENVITITPILRIYNNDGVLLYEKVGDPPTDNLAKLFLWQVAGRYNTDGTGFTMTAQALDGTARSLDPDGLSIAGEEHTAWVLAGTGTTPPSRQDYTISMAGYGEAKVLALFFDSTTNEWVLQLTGVVSFSAAYNITEVGLAVDTFGYGGNTNEIQDPSTAPANNFLVFRDLLPQPIQVTNGDSLTIQYELRVKLP